jgi:hypothetical protein
MRLRSTGSKLAILKYLDETRRQLAGTYLRISWAEGEAAIGERGRVRARGVDEFRGNAVKVRRGREVADADDGEHLARRLEVLPGRGHAAAEHELEAEEPRIPGLVCEGALLVLLVVRAERGEVDACVVRHQRRVVAQALSRDRTADGEHYHADGRPGLDAQPGLHGRRASAPASGSEWLVGA